MENNITNFAKLETTVLELVEEEVNRQLKNQDYYLEINGEDIDISDIEFFKDGVKITAVYHNQVGFAMPKRQAE